MRSPFIISGAFLLVLGSFPYVQGEDLAWAKALGGPYYDGAQAVAMGPGGAVITVGTFVGTADFDPSRRIDTLTSAGGNDVFISKLDPNGRFLWAGRLGGPSTDLALGVAARAGGEVYVVGEFNGWGDFDPGPLTSILTSAGSTDGFITKLDAAGNFVWAWRFGSTGADRVSGVALDESGGVYLTGYFNGTVDFDPGPGSFFLTSFGGSDIFVLKLNEEGQLAWAGQLGGTFADEPLALASTGDAVVTAGRFNGTGDFDPGSGVFNLTSAGQYDAFVTKLDPLGHFIWAVRLGGPLPDFAYGVAVGQDGGIYTAGTFQGTGDFDPGPKNYELSSFGAEDMFVTKLSGGGSFLWAGQLGGSEGDFLYGLKLDDHDFVYTIGDFRSSPGDFDPGSGVFPLMANGMNDSFVGKLDSTGHFVWAGSFGGSATDAARGLAVGTDGSLFIAGAFYSPVDFDPGPGDFSLAPVGLGDAYIFRLSPCLLREAPVYGNLVFPPICAGDASVFPGGPGMPHVFGAASLGVLHRSHDRFFLSRSCDAFRALAVDDALKVNDADSGLGPFAFQPGVPPYRIGAPVDQNIVPQSPPEITNLIPAGASSVLFEAVDTNRQIYGATAVFLVADCGLVMTRDTPTTLRFLSYDAWNLNFAPEFEVRYGDLAQLRSLGGFGNAVCLGHFYNNPGVDTLSPPPPGGGRYYLARGINTCVTQGYGDAEGLVPDPRDLLDALLHCP